MSEEVMIGYWGQREGDGYPFPVPNTALPDQAEMIAALGEAMRNGHMIGYRGWSNCRLCGKTNGTKELQIVRGDTKFRIPEGYIHYLRDHSVGYAPELRAALGKDAKP